VLAVLMHRSDAVSFPTQLVLSELFVDVMSC